ncbi:PD-(D/E)XK nuclease family protein [Mucilaginibacter sp.]|uniref:PDDEXK-like family protein n=1 Tax=Mucilaginibacter sp. TaxID=1882438 RepID=UPI0032664994
MREYESLLNQIKAITTRYEKISELTGENFNVFRILKLDSSEVRMHSAFIGELLNPNGSHGQKDTFLKLFIKAFCFKGNLIDTESSIVEIEKHTGFINGDKTEGGRIDIIITDKHKNHIIIENKIYAGDQENQLLRYHTYSNSADLIYLTLHGKSPTAFSKKDLEEDLHYKCYSYKNEVLKWLESCRKEVAVYPLIREAISHYINLVKHLTNQTINHNMEEEVSTLLKSHIEASWVIASNLDNACQKIAEDFCEDLSKELEKRGLNCGYEVDFKERYSGFYIWKSEWRHVSMAFQFQHYDKDLIYGFLQEDPEKNILPDKLKTELNSLPYNLSKNSVWWPWFNSVDFPYNNWSELIAWQAILDGRMKSIIIEKIEYLLALTENIDFTAK